MSDGAHSAGPQGPHPLAASLAAALDGKPPTRILVLGMGDGRNLPVLQVAGLVVEGVAAESDLSALSGPYGGALSTHALLHGTRASVAERVRTLSALLAPAGLLYATFGSTADPRCGEGTALEGDGWAPTDGAEAGVAHAYFDRGALRRMLRDFDIVSAEERDVRELVGRWAHSAKASAPTVHWLVVARSRVPG